MKNFWDWFLSQVRYPSSAPSEAPTGPLSADPAWVRGFFSGASTTRLRLAQATIEKIIWDRYWNQP